MKKNNLIILSQYFPPDVSGGATRAINYSKCLSHNITFFESSVFAISETPS